MRLKTQPSELIILGGRPGTGKSLFLLNILSKQNKKILLFSLEMSKKAISKRIKQTKYHYKNLVIDDNYDCSLNYIEQKIIELKPDIIAIDYLQLLNNKTNEISRQLKLFALKYNITIIALSQLNREGKEKPSIENLSRSDRIAMDADQIWILHKKGSLALYVLKNRNGANSIIPLRFTKNCQIKTRHIPKYMYVLGTKYRNNEKNKKYFDNCEGVKYKKETNRYVDEEEIEKLGEYSLATGKSWLPQ